MRLLILSVGTRNKLVQYFVEEFESKGKIICTDITKYAPAIYDADKYYLVPPITDRNYIDTILDICKKEQINGVLSLIDPELQLLAEHKSEFDKLGTKLILSPIEVIKTSFNKYNFYNHLIANHFTSQKTILNLENVIDEINSNKIEFPLFIKPNCGSASLNIQKVNNLDTLKKIYENSSDELITQEYIDGKEYGVDVYIDLISKEVISIFIKEKIKMRAGETDKSISIKNEEIFILIKDFVEKMGYLGPIDIDLFEKNGKYYISEVNPRFGGGYPHAYLAGCNFPKYIIENLRGNANIPELKDYKADTVMMKYNEIKFIEE